jgi:hypothetical protein
VSFFKRIMNSIIESRQKQAYREIANILARTDYKLDGADYVYTRLREGKM